MVPLPIFRFADSSGNITTYTFDPHMRDEAGDGPVSLQKTSCPIDVPGIEDTGPLFVFPEPRPGDEFYRYQAEDGADVRYQYDPGSRNGKDYVVAIHRTPENWKRLMEEDLGVKQVESAQGGTQGMGEPMGAGAKMGDGSAYDKRRDSGMFMV